MDKIERAFYSVVLLVAGLAGGYFTGRAVEDKSSTKYTDKQTSAIRDTILHLQDDMDVMRADIASIKRP